MLRATMLKALVTITAGSATQPVNIAPGETFDPAKVGIDKADAERLVAIGSAAEVETVKSATAPPVAIPAVVIPLDWKELKAADMVALALKMGAGDDVKTKDGNAAAEFVAKVAADRAAAGQ